MVVVEDARQRIGERLPVTVTGALQTPTGRMVFARSARNERSERGGSRSGGKPVAAPGHELPGAG